MAGKSIALLLLTIAAAAAAPAIAANDPTVQQIYQAAHAGRLDQAQQMMNQVLRDHPRSGKAHYVAAELYAKEGDAPRARMELGQAREHRAGLAVRRCARGARAQGAVGPDGAPRADSFRARCACVSVGRRLADRHPRLARRHGTAGAAAKRRSPQPMPAPPILPAARRRTARPACTARGLAPARDR